MTRSMENGLEFEVRRAACGAVPLGVDQLIGGYGDVEHVSWGAQQSLPEDAQKGLAVGVVDMEAYDKAPRMFHKKHGCLVTRGWKS